MNAKTHVMFIFLSLYFNHLEIILQLYEK